MPLQPHKFKAWIARRLLTPPLADRFELHHQAQGVTNLVCPLEIDSQAGGDVLAAMLCRQVAEESSEHLAGLEGRQTYLVKAFAGDKATAEFSFYDYCVSLSHAASELGMPIPEERPEVLQELSVQKAVAMMMQQQMRHNEAYARQLVELTSKTTEHNATIMANQQAHIDKLEGRRFETNDLLESLLSKSAEREFARQKFDTDQAQKEKLFGTITEKIIPGLANAWGIKLPPGMNETAAPNDDKTATVKRLFSTLPEEMQNQILESLGEERASELMEAFGYPAAPRKEATH